MIELFNNYNFEYLESKNSLIIFNDCVSTLKSMEAKSVDLIFADPPYNLGKDFGNNSDSWEDKKEYLKDLCNQLQSFIDSNKKILVINMPPRL